MGVQWGGWEGQGPKEPGHILDGADCWCDPGIVEMGGGKYGIFHQGKLARAIRKAGASTGPLAVYALPKGAEAE